MGRGTEERETGKLKMEKFGTWKRGTKERGTGKFRMKKFRRGDGELRNWVCNSN